VVEHGEQQWTAADDARPARVVTVPLDREEWRRYEAALRSYFRRRTDPSDVDDLVQEALLRLFASRRHDELTTPLAYLFRVASNLLVDHARARRRSMIDPNRPVVAEFVAVEADQEYHTLLGDLERVYADALDELSPRCRQVFVMRRHGGHATPEIADTLGISHRMVQKYMVQALELLTVRLKPFVGRA
jgi:RNA polymerase sigma-70 factor (ECF subfamily)